MPIAARNMVRSWLGSREIDASPGKASLLERHQDFHLMCDAGPDLNSIYDPL